MGVDASWIQAGDWIARQELAAAGIVITHSHVIQRRGRLLHDAPASAKSERIVERAGGRYELTIGTVSIASDHRSAIVSEQQGITHLIVMVVAPTTVACFDAIKQRSARSVHVVAQIAVALAHDRDRWQPESVVVAVLARQTSEGARQAHPQRIIAEAMRLAGSLIAGEPRGRVPAVDVLAVV